MQQIILEKQYLPVTVSPSAKRYRKNPTIKGETQWIIWEIKEIKIGITRKGKWSDSVFNKINWGEGGYY